MAYHTMGPTHFYMFGNKILSFYSVILGDEDSERLPYETPAVDRGSGVGPSFGWFVPLLASHLAKGEEIRWGRESSAVEAIRIRHNQKKFKIVRASAKGLFVFRITLAAFLADVARSGAQSSGAKRAVWWHVTMFKISITAAQLFHPKHNKVWATLILYGA